MRKWSFNVESNPKMISKSLESALASVDGLVLNINDDNKNTIAFKIRKRILYAWYLIYQNSIIVDGKLLKTDTKNETKVEVSFSQHFLWKLVLFTDMFLGLGCLIAVISGISNNAYMYIIGGLLVAVGIVLWFAVQKKFEKDIQEYKTLLSKIMEI